MKTISASRALSTDSNTDSSALNSATSDDHGEHSDLEQKAVECVRVKSGRMLTGTRRESLTLSPANYAALP